MLDLGAGAGIVPEMNFKGHARRVCGVDPDPRVADNPHLDEGREGVGESIPYPDASFDVVVSDNVFEHLDNPLAVFREVHRVLRPGGLLLAKTPNRWHYVAIGARSRRIASTGNSTGPRPCRRSTPSLRATAPTREVSSHRLPALRASSSSRSISSKGGRNTCGGGVPVSAGRRLQWLVNSTRLLAPIRVVLIAKLRKLG